MAESTLAQGAAQTAEQRYLAICLCHCQGGAGTQSAVLTDTADKGFQVLGLAVTLLGVLGASMPLRTL
jgi:hypothetical protein